MEITQDVSFTTEHDGMTDTVYASSYSPEEQEELKINKENASLLFSPEFIPFYLEEQRAFDLSTLSTVVYGFIRFYMKNNKNKRFYFTNEQLARILNTNDSSISKSMKQLKDAGLVKSSLKMRANGGTVRFITEVHTLGNSNSTISKIPNQLANKNNINKNISNIDIGPKSYGNELVNYAISEFERVLTYPPTSNRGQSARQGAWNWVRSIQAQLKGKPDDEMSLIVRRLVTSELEWVKRQEWGQITNFSPLSKNLYKFIALLRDGKERLRDAVQETR